MSSSEVSSRLFHTGFRSTFSFPVPPGEDPADAIEEQVRSWLGALTGDKRAVQAWDGNHDTDLPRGVRVQGARSASSGDGGGSRLYRVYVPELVALADSGNRAGHGAPGRDGREQGANERYHRSSIYVFPAQHQGREVASVVIQGATDDASIAEAIDEYEAPSVIADILRSRAAFDGNTRIAADPIVVGPGGGGQVVDAVMDADRQTPVIVAVSPALDLNEEFLALVRELTARMMGTATILFVQADAADELNGLLPEHLRVPAGNVRMFMPNVDAHDPNTGFAHRYIGPAQLSDVLADSSARRGFLPTLYARGPRRKMLHQPLPKHLLPLHAQVEKQARGNRIVSAVRKRLAAQGEESAERGLGKVGQASFDEELFRGVGRVPTAPLEATSVERLRGYLRPADEEVASDPAVVPSGDLDEKEAPLPEEETQSGRPYLDPAASGVRRVVSFVRRWLYPDRHHGVSEENLDQKIVEVDQVLALKEEEQEAALELVDETHREYSRLASSLTDIRRELDDSLADAALLQLELQENTAKAEFYRKELIAAKRFDVLDAVPEDDELWAPPGDVHQVVALLSPQGGTSSTGVADRVRDVVVFTGSLSSVDQVAQRDLHGNYAADTWRFVRTLFDYAQLKKSGVSRMNVASYLKSDAYDGYKVSPKRHSARESDVVRNRDDLRKKRVFPVPTSVDPEGQVFMEAHFRVGGGDGFSPRMYYLDNVDTDGRIYIGYIGKHPRNTKTN